MQLESQRGRRFLILASGDNVATLLDDEVEMQQLDNGMFINGKIPFGHKASLHSIAKGEAIIKYFISICVATSFIEKGDHVHVHNCK